MVLFYEPLSDPDLKHRERWSILWTSLIVRRVAMPYSYSASIDEFSEIQELALMIRSDLP